MSSLQVAITMTRGKERPFALDVAFEIPPGLTVLFGPSGSGKSSTLAAIAGILQPERGSIRLGNQVWYDDSRKISVAAHKRRVALVFQQLALFPHMTAMENVMYGMSTSIEAKKRRSQSLDGLARFSVAHLADRRPASFSGGEAQRVALARALAMEPAVLLLDEPFSALDRDLRKECTRDLERIAADTAIPILHVTHHMGEARTLGHRVILLDQGRVQSIGTPEQLLP